jgi:chemotaxis signal transduction protein
MNKNQQADCQAIHLIEKEYVNNMLGTSCQGLDSSDAASKVVDFNEAYKKQAIECMVFNIAGLHIAVPASNIRKILKQQQILANLQKAPQLSSWIGKIEHDDEIIDVIDIERLAMNGINSTDNSGNNNQPLSDIALLNDSSTGFICSVMLENQTVSQQHVRWRDANSKRIWLAGTVAQMGLSLLDIEGIIRLSHGQVLNN